MTITRTENQVKHTVLLHWWHYTRRENRLCLRLMSESPENLQRLPYLEIVISKIDGIRLRTLRSSYPKTVKEARSYLLSAQIQFLNCLRALRRNNLAEATMYYNLAQDDMTLMRYILMEQGVTTWLS